jgi:hypothetical protein
MGFAALYPSYKAATWNPLCGEHARGQFDGDMIFVSTGTSFAVRPA